MSFHCSLLLTLSCHFIYPSSSHPFFPLSTACVIIRPLQRPSGGQHAICNGQERPSQPTRCPTNMHIWKCTTSYLISLWQIQSYSMTVLIDWWDCFSSAASKVSISFSVLLQNVSFWIKTVDCWSSPTWSISIGQPGGETQQLKVNFINFYPLTSVFCRLQRELHVTW